MTSRTFTLDQLEDLGVEHVHLLKEEVYEGRWTRHSNVVFRDERGKCYLVTIEEGLTENQELWGSSVFPDMSYDRMVECPEVELYEEMVPVVKWREVV